MATARDRLKPKQNDNGDSSLALQVRPVIKMGAPKIDIPEIKIPEIKVSAQASDMKPIADAIMQLGQAITAIANTQTQILQALANQQMPEVKVSTPPAKVTMPARPNEFYVELDKENGETVGMRISANSPEG